MSRQTLTKRSLRQLAQAAGVVKMEPGFEEDATEVANAFGHTAIRSALGILERRGKGLMISGEIMQQALQTVRGSSSTVSDSRSSSRWHEYDLH